MEPNEIHQSIAQQIDHMKPDDLTPGKGIGMEVMDENTLAILLPGAKHERIHVRYDAGPDTYTVTRMSRARGAFASLTNWIEDAPVSGIYCDQLGELVFGEKAKAWTQPFGGISVQNPDGSWTQVSEF